MSSNAAFGWRIGCWTRMMCVPTRAFIWSWKLISFLCFVRGDGAKRLRMLAKWMPAVQCQSCLRERIWGTHIVYTCTSMNKVHSANLPKDSNIHSIVYGEGETFMYLPIIILGNLWSQGSINITCPQLKHNGEENKRSIGNPVMWVWNASRPFPN